MTLQLVMLLQGTPGQKQIPTQQLKQQTVGTNLNKYCQQLSHFYFFSDSVFFFSLHTDKSLGDFYKINITISNINIK